MKSELRKRFEAWFDDESVKPRSRRLGWDHQLACAEWGIAEGLRIAAEFEAGRCCPVCSAPDGFEISQRHFESLLAQEEKK